MIRLPFALLVLALAVRPAAAGAPGPPPSTASKVMWSEAVVLGKVIKVEAEALEALPYVGATAKVKMNVATIKIESALIGAKNLTELRVLMVAKPEQPRPGRAGPVQLADNQEGLFFLSRLPSSAGDFVIQYAPISSTARTFKADVDTVKGIAAVLADPQKALTTGNADDRISAANTLLARYRRVPPSQSKGEEAIPAAETKAILKALLDADWTTTIREGAGRSPFGPRGLLEWIGLYPGTPGGLPAITVGPNEDINAKYFEAYKAWHSKHAATFEIKKLVPKDEK